ncbi:hypothetical protein COY25_03940 [Candidatus Uhrbacteria bacterium CG_4_10_14_0_2_um_filter_41_7]|uniref:Uncharacterized protein n=1 Tax=Candidatus Uhrbacteria bacterium CG_4_9_14_3_um_filter_41_35 TaxID=1975034 RepID=A0A2M7XD93_9BACT|nr:MAG: hypothetical protein COV92_01995 [Candidatus Uhrbacteria bacterium CG11_big_fil_rev_8_21_14_0_20_41_9]PIZ53153.1 MAG: hypothetical protein COY25_03940 [Candidatus Uhrbacteria bacterium CG_4_10_14_0_2_um_filter_41_7]PJA45833.1 MAG: hypothetical protein CO173_04660 [Candidatus Uhrbacteria bacterium CG_4_9_14_3_um_filter_41_35]
MSNEDEKIFRVAKNRTVHVPRSALVRLSNHLYYLVEDSAQIFEHGGVLAYNHRQKVWHYFASLDKFDRSLGHTKDGYGYGSFQNEGYISVMLRLIQTCLDLNGQVRAWKRLSADERVAFTAQALEAKAELSGALHEERIQMAWRLGDSAECRDSLGRQNPGKSAAQLIAAGDNGYRLYRAMIDICGHIEERHLLVRQLIAHEEHEMRLRHLEIGSIIYEVEREAGRGNFNHAIWQISELILRLEVTHFQPWRNAYRRCIVDDLRPASILLNAGHSGSALQRLRRVKFVLEALEFQREYVDWMRRAFAEIEKRPRKEHEKSVHVAKLALLHSELEAMRASLVQDATGKVVVDKTLRSPVLAKFYKRTALGSHYFGLGLYEEARTAFREAELAW